MKYVFNLEVLTVPVGELMVGDFFAKTFNCPGVYMKIARKVEGGSDVVNMKDATVEFLTDDTLVVPLRQTGTLTFEYRDKETWYES